MQTTTITKRWQTVIPSTIRKRHQINEGDALVWLDKGQTLRLIPIRADSLRALRGRGKGERLTEKLLSARAKDREREKR